MSAGRAVGTADAARAALDARAGGPAVAVVTSLVPADRVARLLAFGDGSVRGTLGDPALDEAAREAGMAALAGEPGAVVRRTEAGTLYIETHRAPARLFVIGAGHIAVPLVRLGALLGFPVVVLDDREDFATGERFPDAARVRRLDFDAPFREEAPRADDFVVLVTRAHRYDFDCLTALLAMDPPPRYIGMVGSRRRVRAAFRALLDAGVPHGRLAAVHAPIGLSIGAETPEEIALSIGAELVAVRRGVEAGGSLRDRERVVARHLASGEGEQT